MKFFLLDKQQNIIGRLSEEYILEATFTEEINTAGELLITLPAKKRLSGNVIHVLITNPSKDHSYLMFKIIKETVKDEEVEYTAVESAYDELTSYGYIQDKRPTANAQTITEMILKDTRWHVGEIPDTSEAFISFYYLSVLDCLKKIVQTFDFEIGFDVLINDAENQITDRRVNFYIKQGEQTGKRFEYGSNLLSVKQEQDTQNIYTALVGRGKGVQVSDGDDDNTPDGYGRRITFADVEWSKANGDPLDKPKGQEWLEDPDATKQLGFSDGHMRIGLEVFEDVDDPKVLLQKTYEALKTAERPQVQFSASVINTGELHLGDRVGITRNDIGIAYETRVFKVQHNLLDETQNKIDLGDNLEQTNNLSYQVSALQSEVTNNTEGIITVTQSANGKNKVYYSSTMPATGSNGDVWYKDLGNGETEMYIYDNGWQLVISTENLHKIEDEVKQQQAALDKAVQDANTASAKADGLVAQVGDANTNAQKALATAQQNQADLAQAKNDLQNTKNQLTNVQSDLTGTKSSLAGAISNISQAQEDLENTEQGLQGVKSDLENDEKNLSDLTKQAQTQGQTIVDIRKTQSGLSADIADVKGNVSSLKDTADGLQATVGTLSSDNLISNSDCLTDTPGVAPDTDWKAAWDWLYSDGNFPVRANWYGYSALQLNRQISSNWAVFSAPVKSGKPSQDTDYAFNMKFYITTAATYDVFLECGYTKEFKTTKDIKLGTLPVDKTGSWQSFQAKCTVPRGFSWVRLKITSSTSNPYFWIAQPMLSYGTTQKPYVSSNYPAQKMASISETVDGIKATVSDNANGISQIKQTAQSIERDVANNKNDISSIKQTADSLKSSIQDDEKNISSLQQTAQGLQGSISDNKNNIANIQATAQGLQTSVEDNKKNISTVQQQANSLESAISATNSDNLVVNSDCFTNVQGVAPNTDWKPAWGWRYSSGKDIGRANWYGYSALQINQIPAEGYACSQGIKAGKPGSETTYAVSLKYMIQKQGVRYWVNIQADYDESFSNPIYYDLGNATNVDGHNYQTFTATVTIPAEKPWIRLIVGCEGDNGYIWIAQPMIVYGSTIPTQYISSNQPGQKMSSIKQTIDSIQSTVQSNSGQISQVKQTADGLQSTVTNNSNDISSLKQTATGLQSTVSNMKVSSENLLPDTLDFAGWQQGGQGSMDNAKDDNTLTNAWHAWGDNNSAWIGSPQTKPVYLSAGTQYTFSAVCWNNGSLTGNNFDDDDVELYFNNNDNSKAYNHQLTGKTNKDHIRYSVTFTVDTDGLYWGFKLIDKSGFIGGSLWSAEYMLVEGNIATAYQPSSTAMATDISTIQQTIDGVKIDVANSKGDISSLKQRADSIETNISNNSNDISSLKQTANSLQSNIQSKADISQITQLSNAVQSVVQSVGSFFPNGNFADSNVQVYWSPWDVTKDYTNISYDAATYNGSFGNLLLHAAGGGYTKAISTEYIPVQPNKSVTISLASRGDWYNSNGKPQLLQCYVHFYDSKKNGTENGHFDLNCSNNQQWYDNSVTYDCNSNECYIRIEIVLQGNQENWAHITNVKVSSDGGESISSKISQMADDINMRVQKGDLLSQINIQAGSTLIQSNKLYLDASSVVFSGNAFIPSAAITDLSADKITAGTLNAGNVNIINLDVNKLVGNTTEFVRSGWTNAYGSHVQIDGGGMAVSYGDWYTRFDGNGMTFKNGNEALGGFTRIGMNTAPSWYNGLAFNAGGDAEFLSIGAQDYGNDSQNPVPAKLLWMRQGINTYGYQPGWNFCDDVWMNKLAVNSFHYGNWDIKFGLISGSNGYSALTLTNGSGGGFFWGSDGGFGFAAGGHLYDMRGKPLINEVGSNGVAQSWTNINY